MKTGIRCFAGCNTALGFTSGFEGIFASRARTFFIKGSPGAGKSGLMTRIGARQAALGHPVSYFHCSSDPDSLDGIVDEAINAAMLDATSPHAYDPPLPGASGSILSLGDYLNEQALMNDQEEIQNVNLEISQAFHEAQSYLAAARSVRSAVQNPPRAEPCARIAEEILHLLPRRAGIGANRRYFLSAHTCKGFISFLSQFPKEETISIPCPFSENLSSVFRKICDGAIHTGLDAICFLNPVNPDRIDHLFLPEIPLFLTTQPVPGARRTIAGVFDKDDKADDAQALYHSLTGQAENALVRAKRLHDELEAFYSPRMDFSRLVEVESRVQNALDALQIRG